MRIQAAARGARGRRVAARRRAENAVAAGLGPEPAPEGEGEGEGAAIGAADDHGPLVVGDAVSYEGFGGATIQSLDPPVFGLPRTCTISIPGHGSRPDVRVTELRRREGAEAVPAGFDEDFVDWEDACALARLTPPVVAARAIQAVARGRRARRRYRAARMRQRLCARRLQRYYRARHARRQAAADAATGRPVLEMARYLGVDTLREPALIWLAEQVGRHHECLITITIPSEVGNH